MKKFKYSITEELGLHARPVGMLVILARKYESKITIKKGDVSTDLRRIYAVMQLEAKQGDTVEFCVDGPDEDLAVKELEEVCKNNL